MRILPSSESPPIQLAANRLVPARRFFRVARRVCKRGDGFALEGRRVWLLGSVFDVRYSSFDSVSWCCAPLVKIDVLPWDFRHSIARYASFRRASPLAPTEGPVRSPAQQNSRPQRPHANSLNSAWSVLAKHVALKAITNAPQSGTGQIAPAATPSSSAFHVCCMAFFCPIFMCP